MSDGIIIFMITCLLLSAGLSTRFGSPKALVPLGNQNIIQYLQDTLLKTSCDEIIVVTGACADQIKTSVSLHSRVRIVYNKDYNLGQTSSVQAGLREIPETAEGFMLLPVDCFLVKPSSIDQIIAYFKKQCPEILIPTYQNKKGHPSIFNMALKSEILKLPLDYGLNSLFSAHQPQLLDINDPGIIKSFNTPQELRELHR